METANTNHGRLEFEFEGELHTLDEIEFPINLVWEDEDGNTVEGNLINGDRNLRMLAAFQKQHAYLYGDEASEADEIKSAPKKRRHRTNDVVGIAKIPDYSKNPLADTHREAFHLGASNKTHLVVIRRDIMPNLTNGRITLTSPDEAIQAYGHILKTGQDTSVTSVDSELLATLYTIIYDELAPELMNSRMPNYNDTLNFGVTVAVNDIGDVMFAKHVGKGYTEKEIASIIARIRAFENTLGILASKEYPGEIAGIYPGLQWRGYNRENKTISFGSPFLSMLAYQVFTEARKLDANGKARVTRSGAPILSGPVNSALVKSTINREKNKRAAVMVRIICNVIETNETTLEPSISALTIIKRVDGFMDYLENTAPSNRARCIHSTFAKAFELLRTQTYLTDVYKNIRLPNPDDYPRWSDLKKRYYFPHKGINNIVYDRIRKGDF